MFVDQATIYVKGGDGGNGIVAYRREKYVPLGGPAGGDGGHGANVVFVVDEGLRTLVDFRYQRHYKATKGENGRPKNQHGKGAQNLEVKVPPGTIVKDADTGEFLGDLVAHGQKLIVAKGGRGGRGNTRFATAGNKAPDMAEKGEPGEERWLALELRVLADVGLVGFPSVGKSTLLAKVSAAKPKIGAYHFTTLSPEIGVVHVDEERTFVLADLPGLIEGAHEGLGLGHEFLRHVARTRVLIHVVDMAAIEGRDPVEDYRIIETELVSYDESLLARPQVVAANKMDVPTAAENLVRFQREYPDIRVFPISGITGDGIAELLGAIIEMVHETSLIEPEWTTAEQDEDGLEHKVYRYEPEQPFQIRRDGSAFVVESPELEKMVHMLNFSQYDAVKKFQRTMKRRGVDEALRQRGAQEGDVIRIGDMEFEFIE